MTVGELGRRMSSAELAEWQAFDTVVAEERREAELEARAKQGLAGRRR